jgi:uncharacterized protein (TIGR02271 family)
MTKTVIGLFNNTREAQRAVLELVTSGIPREDIGVTSQDYMAGERTGYDSSAETDAGDKHKGIGEKISNFFSSLFGGDDANNVGYYSDAVRRGGAVVTVDAETDDAANRAAALMDQYGATDVDERGAQSQTGGYASAGARDREAQPANLAEGGEVAIPVMEEELQVGKRQVERGGARVRSRVIERPVEEVVRLREERVRVERRPVNRPVTEADLRAFREGTIEVTERAEEPVVSKQARVIEEVVVGKDVGERTETVRDTVRRTEVDVEETGSKKSKDPKDNR